MENDNILEVRDLSIHFKSNKAVDRISFNVKRGEVFGLVGESGCGKTTTGRTIVQLYTPTGGEIFLNGNLVSAGPLEYINRIAEAKKALKGLSSDDADKAADLKQIVRENKQRLKKLKSRYPVNTDIQMIFQDPIASLDPRMTVRDIIAEGLIIGKQCKKSEITEKVYAVLESVGMLPEHASRYPHEFSGGQRQRIGIARAIIMQPKIIIADEPVSALDVSIQAQVITILNELRKSLGLTIVFIAHDISVVKYISDRIAVMYYGKIVEQADSDELFLNPLHPYTRSLFSAIPYPDPNYEKNRVRMVYNPVTAHDYASDKPSMHEITPGHFIHCNEAEFSRYLTELKQA